MEFTPHPAILSGPTYITRKEFDAFVRTHNSNARQLVHLRRKFDVLLGLLAANGIVTAEEAQALARTETDDQAASLARVADTTVEDADGPAEEEAGPDESPELDELGEAVKERENRPAVE